MLNHLGGEYTEGGLNVLRRGGRMVLCGRTAGGRSEINVPQLFLDHKRVIGSTMGTQSDLVTLVQLLADDAFEPMIDKEYDFSETSQAFADMQDRYVVGKLVVHP